MFPFAAAKQMAWWKSASEVLVSYAYELKCRGKNKLFLLSTIVIKQATDLCQLAKQIQPIQIFHQLHLNFHNEREKGECSTLFSVKVCV